MTEVHDNSGNVSEQLPVAFVGYRGDGRRVERGTPVQGQFIQKEGA